MQTKLLQSRVREDVYKQLQDIAVKKRTHVAGLVRILVMDYLKQNEEMTQHEHTPKNQ